MTRTEPLGARRRAERGGAAARGWRDAKTAGSGGLPGAAASTGSAVEARFGELRSEDQALELLGLGARHEPLRVGETGRPRAG